MTAIAVFDFDGTLICGDSLVPFCAFIAGPAGMRRAFMLAIRDAVWRRRLGVRASGDDFRTEVKKGVLSRCLRGATETQIDAASERLSGWLQWHAPILAALQDHAAKGDRVVVATGALAIYMPRLLADLPVTDILATELEMEGGQLTGEMRGENCVRREKARRVADFLQRNGPFRESWGYGNRPSDLPFLALMDHKTIVPTVHRRRLKMSTNRQ